MLESKNMKYVLRIYLPALLVGPVALFYAFSWGLLPFVLLGWVLISGLGISVGFHRVFSHKTHNLNPWLENLILFLGTIGGQGSSITWVAVHRGSHHRFSDTPKDLHSPVHGIFHSIFTWYTKVNEHNLSMKPAVDLLRKPMHVRFHKHYTLIVWSLVIFLSLVNVQALVVYLSCLFISLLQDNSVNVFCHIPKFGYRNFETKDFSRNVPFLGYFGWGQGWHNNHHEYPARFDFGIKWWEYDPCRIFLPLLVLGSKRGSDRGN